ncbi:MAG: CUAEP/CCAEP-tail radical SAM protein [Bryobacteraceae bacterium]|nr:CUAEP/CCAEP-tail radical SAM protein [Bryobacteraceae bacterium]
MNIVLLNTYELGRQPFGLASPAAWLRERGHRVVLVDLAVSPLPSLVIREAQLVCFYLPMHTATRLAGKVVERVRLLNPQAALCAYGLYAPLNAEYLRGLGIPHVFGGEFEPSLAALADALEAGSPPPVGPLISLDRIEWRVPDRTGLPALPRYARLRVNGDRRLVGYTEASRGCKHLCRHCPVVPVYQGRFRAVPVETVLADVRAQVEAGAQHITFGDPDFFNGPAHALRMAERIHADFPALTFDATIKVEHLLRHRDLLPALAAYGCLFVTTAVESVDDRTLALLEKGHTRADFIEAVGVCAASGITLSPTFIPFTPWTTADGYRDLLALIERLGLIENVSPVQLALRLLVPASSRLLELGEVRAVLEGFDPSALVWRWRHPDPQMDALSGRMLRLVNEEQRGRRTRSEIFERIVQEAGGPRPDEFRLLPRAAIPYLDEPWYC